ncbi:hypothetical protein, partial [Leptotrichia sp. OH3620_COT-345]|uniref:hypothetical protein n=1 Tax=Leptotrichia sp. OH3620_COT-345 TaxID=2491048 RepID=UPI001315AB65
LRSYGTPIRRNTLSSFEKPLGIRFKGSALNTPDFVANTNKLFSLSGESRLVNISNIDKVKEHSWKDKTGHLPIGKAALREQLMPGLFIPVLPDSKKIGKP